MGKTIQVYGFPYAVSAEEVKDFLESKTGQGTVFALKVRPGKNGKGRSFAIVQFTAAHLADHIRTLADSRLPLRYGESYLKARAVDNDIVPKPRVFSCELEDVTLYFGCQVANNKFSVLRKSDDVIVKFGVGMRKLQFFLSYDRKEFKLDLSYENIWQVELHRSRRQAKKYLLIQLLGAPAIFEKEVQFETSLFFHPFWNFYKNVPDDHWARSTDFTESCCIGQSSALCLELSYVLHLPSFRDNFAIYRQIDDTLLLQNGNPYSHCPDLVPIIAPSGGVNFPFDILFKVNTLVQNGCIPGPAIHADFYSLVDPCIISRVYIEHALERLFHLKECCYDPVRWLTEQYRNYLRPKNRPSSPAISLDDGLVYIRRVQITPCKVYFCGPEINVSNRVLRNYSDYIDNFLRITFVDEDLDKIHSTDLSRRTSAFGDKKTRIFSRILSTLKDGIVIGSKKFEFLAFSSSQLRENSAWMFASTDGCTASDIRSWMGDFHEIRNVAKYAARLGQSFSSSRETITVADEEMEIVADIETVGSKYVFSDGIGKISADFAKKVAKKCGLKDGTPSAFQIRIGGFKGVVAIDPTSSKKLSLRKSMSKYKSSNRKLDVLAWSKYQPCFLNRQLITLLSTLGVPDHVFEKKQREAIDHLDAILTDPVRAHEALDLMSPGENANVLKAMLRCGYKPTEEPYLSMMLQTFRASKLQELRTKSRVFIWNGRSMMGCLDETRTLEYGEVFVQFSSSGYRQYEGSSIFDRARSDQMVTIVGKVVVAKNPCLHPGDVRVLRAVNIPALKHMVDCVVFPQKGKRPHPNECSGSDLDGDIYFVCWDQELIPRHQEEPMDYTPAPSVTLDHDVSIQEVEEYFTNYILNDSLGIIANAHTAFADRVVGKAMSPNCIELARLFSIAVDFPKTGVPAEIPQHLYVKEYPDFMEKLDKPTYESKNVIGKLFREVKAKDLGRFASFTKEMARKSYDREMEVDGYEDYLEDAYFHKSNFDYKLGNLMDYYGIRSEAEMLSGSIMKMSKSFTKNRDTEAIGMAVRSLRKEARSWFAENGNGKYAKASAWYHVTYHPDYWGCYNEGMKRDHYLSFAWCVYDKLIEIKKYNTRKTERMSLLEAGFADQLHLS